MKTYRMCVPKSIKNSLDMICIDRKITDKRNKYNEALLVMDTYAKIGQEVVKGRKNDKIF